MTTIATQPAPKISDDQFWKERWQADPILFMTQALDVNPEHIWPKMEEVACSVRDNEKTVVGAGHSVSKTYGAARLALWFLYCHYPSTVITTAPTFAQVEQLLWREIAESYENAKYKPLGGSLTKTRLDLQGEAKKIWFAYGFATQPDSGGRQESVTMQGYHNKHMLVIFDEAAGILPAIWKTAQHLATSGHVRFLAIGNPTSATGDFAEALEPVEDNEFNHANPSLALNRHGFHPINISVKDTPNFQQGEEVIPGLSGRRYEETMRKKYGADSTEYAIRIEGKLPKFSSGTFFGREMSKAKEDGRIGGCPHDPMAKVYTAWDIGHTNTAIWFVQFIKQEIRLIDFYYDDKGLGMPAYASMLAQKGYNYAQHLGPHDIAGSNARNVQTGLYLKDTAAELGVRFTVLPMHPFVDGISGARDLIGMCWFNETTCAAGIEALTTYKQQLNAALSTDSKPVYKKAPIANWTVHPADAFRYLAMAYRYDLIVEGERIGYPGALVNEVQMRESEDDDNYDPLGGAPRRR